MEDIESSPLEPFYNIGVGVDGICCRKDKEFSYSQHATSRCKGVKPSDSTSSIIPTISIRALKLKLGKALVQNPIASQV